MQAFDVFHSIGLVPPGESPVEAGIDIDIKGPGLLAAPAATTSRDVKVELRNSELLGEKTAVGSEALACFLEVSSLELNTATLVHAQHGEEGADQALSTVDLVLLLGVSGAERRIERTGESLLTHAVAGLVVELSTAVGGLAARRRSGRSVSALVVTVGTSNDDLEVIAALTSVGSGLLGNLLSPDRALVVDDGRRVGAGALVGVPFRVALNVDVEASTGVGLVAELGASVDIVACEDLVGDVTVAGGGTLQVDERLLVTLGRLGRDSELLVLSIVVEAIDSVILGRVARARRLRSTWVIRVDEPAVGADLDLSGASGVSGESVGVDPIDGSARGGNDTIGGGWGLGGLRTVAVDRSYRRSGSSLCGSRSGGCGRLRSRGRGRIVLHRLPPRPPEGAGLKRPLIEASLSGLSSSSTGGSSSSLRLGGTLNVSSLLSRTDTDRRALSESSKGIKTSGVEVLRSRVGGDEGSSPKDNRVAHSE